MGINRSRKDTNIRFLELPSDQNLLGVSNLKLETPCFQFRENP